MYEFMRAYRPGWTYNEKAIKKTNIYDGIRERFPSSFGYSTNVFRIYKNLRKLLPKTKIVTAAEKYLFYTVKKNWTELQNDNSFPKNIV